MGEEKSNIKRRLDMAEKYLAVLEEQAAAHTILTIPATLKIELDEMREKVQDLKSSLGKSSDKDEPIVFWVPRRTFFVGRSDDIKRCITSLSPEDRTWGVMIDGIGGIGKTAFATEVAYVAFDKQMFDAYIYVSAKTSRLMLDGIHQDKLRFSSFDAFIRETATQLGYTDIASEKDPEERRKNFLAKLRGRSVLIIWDNLETLSRDENDKIINFLRTIPDPNKAMVTSRRRPVESGAVIIRLDKLSKAEIIELIKGYESTSDSIRNQILGLERSLLDELYNVSGGNPLIVQQMLGLINQRNYTIEKSINVLKDAEKSKDVYAFLFAHAAQEMNENEKKILSALAFQRFSTIESLKAATNLSLAQVSDSVDNLVTLSLVNAPLDGKYFLHSLIANYVQMILNKEIPSQNTQFGNVTLDPDAKSRMLDYWVEFATENSVDTPNAQQNIQQEWVNLEATTEALFEATGLPAEMKDKRSATALIKLALALCGKEAPLFILGYWDESITLASWGFQASKKLEQSDSMRQLGLYLAKIYSLKGQTEMISDIYRQINESTHIEPLEDSIGIVRKQISINRLKRLLLSNNKEKMAIEKEILGDCIRVNDKEGEAQTRIELAILHMSNNNHKEADEELNKAYEVAKAESSKILQARILNVFGDRAMHRIPIFTETVIGPIYDVILDEKKNTTKFGQVLGWITLIATILPVLLVYAVDAVIESQVRPDAGNTDPKKAREYYKQALALAENVNAYYEAANAKFGLASVLIETNEYDDALVNAKSALEIYEKLNANKNIEKTKKLIERITALEKEQAKKKRQKTS